MKYKIGDKIVCNVETRAKGHKYIMTVPNPKFTFSSAAFQIAAINKHDETYLIIIDDDMVGFVVSAFHIMHAGVAKAFLGKKFWEVPERFVFGTKTD